MKHQLPLKLSLDHHARLDDYVGTAASQLSDLSGLILLAGPKGSGKSHLLQGLCRQVMEGGRSAIYLGSPGLLAPSVLENLEAAETICLDDVDEVIEDPEWQLALFHMINACRDRGGRLVLATRSPERLLTVDLPDLGSRLRAAYRLVADEPEDDDKLEVIRLKAERRGFDMSEEVCRFILSRAQRDMHHLARLVEQLEEETLKRQHKVTIPFVKSALGL